MFNHWNLLSTPKQSIFVILAKCKYLMERRAASWFPRRCLKEMFIGKNEKGKHLSSSVVFLPPYRAAVVLHSISLYSSRQMVWCFCFRCGLCPACQLGQLGTSCYEHLLSVAYNFAKLSSCLRCKFMFQASALGRVFWNRLAPFFGLLREWVWGKRCFLHVSYLEVYLTCTLKFLCCRAGGDVYQEGIPRWWVFPLIMCLAEAQTFEQGWSSYAVSGDSLETIVFSDVSSESEVGEVMGWRTGWARCRDAQGWYLWSAALRPGRGQSWVGSPRGLCWDQWSSTSL